MSDQSIPAGQVAFSVSPYMMVEQGARDGEGQPVVRFMLLGAMPVPIVCMLTPQQSRELGHALSLTADQVEALARPAAGRA